MKMRKLTSIAIAVLLGALSANAQIIFQDTFNTPNSSWGNVTNDLVARQAGGTTSSTYTLVNIGGDPETDSVIYEERMLTRISNGPGSAHVILDTDFGPSLLNTTWVLSFSSLRGGDGLGGGWSGFSVGTNSPPDTPFTHGFGFILGGTGGWSVWNDGAQVGSGVLGFAMAHAWYDMTATVDEASNTVSLVFEDLAHGTINLGTFPTSFGAAGTRFVGLRSHVDAMPPEGIYADMYTENLQIEVLTSLPPPEIGLIAIDQLSGTNALSLTWATGAGYGYTVERKVSLLDANWTNDITGIVGTGGDVTVTTAVDQAKSFYRVIGE